MNHLGTKVFHTISSILFFGCAHFQTKNNGDLRTPAQSITQTTPNCSIPIFSWSKQPISKNDVIAYTTKHILGSLEETQTKWDPSKNNLDLAGNGMYFAGDPFSTKSNEDHLVIAMLKPNQSMKDLRPLGLLEDGNNEIDSVKKDIRSESKIILHNSSVKTGVTSVIALRANKNESLANLPIDVKSLEVVDIPSKAQLWKMHKLVNTGDSFQTVINEYSDQISVLHSSWEAWDKNPSDKIIWLALNSDLQLTFREIAETLAEDYQIDIFESLMYNDNISTEVISEFSTDAKAKYYLKPDSLPEKQADLKKDLITSWKTTVGFKNFISVYTYLQNYKKSIGIKKRESDEAFTNPSTLEASCHP